MSTYNSTSYIANDEGEINFKWDKDKFDISDGITYDSFIMYVYDTQGTEIYKSDPYYMAMNVPYNIEYSYQLRYVE